MYLIDSHCHLDYFSADELPHVVARAEAAGVAEMVTIGTRLSQTDQLITLASGSPRIWCTVGVHPHNAGEEAVPEAKAIAELVEHPKVIGIGESGLDYFYDKAPRDMQQASFRQHIRAARLAGVPLAIHARDADSDIAQILTEERADGPFDFLLHCFPPAAPWRRRLSL